MIKPALIGSRGTISILVVALCIGIPKPLDSSSCFFSLSSLVHLLICTFVYVTLEKQEAYTAPWFHKKRRISLLSERFLASQGGRRSME
jgi:hypothetical protein